MTKVKTTKKKKEIIEDLPFDESPNGEPEKVETKMKSVVETLQDPQTHVITLLQRYVIADQTDLLKNFAMGHIGFEFEMIINMKDIDAFNVSEYKYLLITNDLANKLIQKKEMILRNSCGTWWIVEVTDEMPLVKNETLLAIVNEALGVK